MRTRSLVALTLVAIAYGNGSPTALGQIEYVLSDASAQANLVGFETAAHDCGCDAKGKGAAGYGDPGDCRCFDDWCGPWRVTTDILFVDRDTPGNAVLVDNAGGAAPQTLLSSRDLDPNHETGFRVDLYHQTNDCVAWQVGFDGANWDTQTTLLAANRGGRLRALLNTGDDFDAADQVSTNYFSDYDSWEINRHHCLHDTNITWLVGVRHVSLDENFTLAATRGAQTSNYDIGTENSIWGGQFGLDWKRMVHQRCCIGINSRFVVGGNSGNQNVLLRDDGNTQTLRQFNNDGSSVAFLGEVDFSVCFRIHDCCYLRGGYQLLWLTGVALAPEQYQFNAADPDAAINIDGTAFLSGFFFGVEGTL